MKKHDILLFGTIVGAAVSVLASSVGASMVTEDAAVPTAADSADYIKKNRTAKQRVAANKVRRNKSFPISGRTIPILKII